MVGVVVVVVMVLGWLCVGWEMDQCLFWPCA